MPGDYNAVHGRAHDVSRNVRIRFFDDLLQYLAADANGAELLSGTAQRNTGFNEHRPGRQIGLFRRDAFLAQRLHPLELAPCKIETLDRP